MDKKISILLVEDEVVTAMLMENKLNGMGFHEILHVTTGEDAIISAKQNSPDIILMDIRLAGEIDGIDAAEAIKAESDIPVIYITGYDDKENRDRAEKTKPLAFLIKPPQMNTLKDIIVDHFKNKKIQ